MAQITCLKRKTCSHVFALVTFEMYRCRGGQAANKKILKLKFFRSSKRDFSDGGIAA